MNKLPLNSHSPYPKVIKRPTQHMSCWKKWPVLTWLNTFSRSTVTKHTLSIQMPQLGSITDSSKIQSLKHKYVSRNFYFWIPDSFCSTCRQITITVRSTHVGTWIWSGVSNTRTTAACRADHAGAAAADAGTTHATGTGATVATPLPVFPCRSLSRSMFLDIVSHLWKRCSRVTKAW